MPRNGARRSGFTLIELMIVLSIMSIILILSFPSFNRLMAQSQLNTARYDVSTFINMARTLAITRGKRVVLCPSLDQDNCHNEGEWHRGMIVFHDPNRNRMHDPDEEILLANDPMGPGVKVVSSRFRRKISYLPSGLSSGTNLTIRLCHDTESVPSQAIIVSNTGRLRIKKDLENDCS